jgi:hypothetical protein
MFTQAPRFRDKAWRDLSSYVLRAREEKAAPLTVVVGAGVNQLHVPSNAAGHNAKKLLCSWDALLCELTGENFLGVSQTLRWELAALKQKRDSKASADIRDRRLRIKLKEEVFKAEKRLLRSGTNDSGGLAHLTRVLLAPVVTDVISLNVDLIIERIVAGEKVALAPVRKATSSLGRHREFVRAGETPKLRIWHPHGDRENAASLSFGLWRYEQLLSPMRKARVNLKKRESESNFETVRREVATRPTNWVEMMMLRPLLFIGTSLDDAEWDMWYALLMRWRNFAKGYNRKFEHPVWVLSAASEGSNVSSLHKLRGHRFDMLEAPNWPTAWEWLADTVTGRV